MDTLDVLLEGWGWALLACLAATALLIAVGVIELPDPPTPCELAAAQDPAFVTVADCERQAAIDDSLAAAAAALTKGGFD